MAALERMIAGAGWLRSSWGPCCLANLLDQDNQQDVQLEKCPVEGLSMCEAGAGYVPVPLGCSSLSSLTKGFSVAKGRPPVSASACVGSWLMAELHTVRKGAVGVE